jgi:arylsulfatase A-like enzyme
MKYAVFSLLLLAIGPGCRAAEVDHGKAHHVVVVVWDGMRPDFVSEKTTPNLWKLAQQGVTFRRHHPVYTSSTEVNGTAMATGVYPEHSGVMANREYRPAVDPLQTVGTELPATIQATKGDYLAAPTLVQILHGAGLRTAVAGTKGVALLQDWSHNGTTEAARESVVFYDGKTAPERAMAEMTGTLGAWPETIEFPNIPEDAWTTQALTEVLWKKGLPAYSMLWMSDPDYSQHQMAPGSQMALAALKNVDDRLATVLEALDTTGLRNDTDIFVISDHGFSTVRRADDVVTPLNAMGLKVSGTAFAAQPQSGEILAVGNGASMMFYVIGHDEEVGRKLTRFLQTTDYAGVIFSRWNLPGTFDLHTGHIATKDAPDVVMALHWTSDPNMYGAPGMVDGDGGRKKGKGTHASLSPYEMHNTLIAAGPDFRKGWDDDTPTGNIDLAPTVLWILGVPHARPMDGRVLLEAMPGRVLGSSVSQQVLRAENPDTGWKQYLKVSRVGSTEYFDEGNRGTGGD